MQDHQKLATGVSLALGTLAATGQAVDWKINVGPYKTYLHKAFGVGMMLKGGGTVAPVSKYEIQSLVRANFHSVSDFSDMIWNEFDIMAINMLSRTMMLQTE